MKNFDDQTYYEILEIAHDASHHEVKRAYQEALNLYEENSLVTYALFSDEERADLLHAIEAAFYTLTDDNRRRAYNQQLIASGYMQAEVNPESPNEALSSPESQKPFKHKDLNSCVKNRSQEAEIVRLNEEIMGKDLVSGQDLKRLRKALDIEFSAIYEITRISGSTLTMIEENQFHDLPADVFLRSFLKSYAEILQIDSHRVVEGYFKYKSLAEKTSK
jgi:DnaJ-class molecular chaperone